MTAFDYEHGNAMFQKNSEADKKEKKKKKKDKTLKGVQPNIFDKYNGMETKSNVNNSLIKSLVDVAAAGLIGPALSAALGKYSPLAGIAITFGGHYTGEQSGLMRGVGMSTIAHAVAKAKDYRQSDSTLKNRLSDLKDDWLSMILLGNSTQNKSIFNGIENKVEIEPLNETASIEALHEDMPNIDQELADFEENTQSFLENQAMEYEQEMAEQTEQEEIEQFESSPFDWQFNEPEQPNVYTSTSEHMMENELPDDFDFSEL